MACRRDGIVYVYSVAGLAWYATAVFHLCNYGCLECCCKLRLVRSQSRPAGSSFAHTCIACHPSTEPGSRMVFSIKARHDNDMLLQAGNNVDRRARHAKQCPLLCYINGTYSKLRLSIHKHYTRMLGVYGRLVAREIVSQPHSHWESHRPTAQSCLCFPQPEQSSQQSVRSLPVA